jgi:hypothetical protein
MVMTSINGFLNGAITPATLEHSLSPTKEKVEKAVFNGLQMLSFAQSNSKSDLARAAVALTNQLQVGSDSLALAPQLNTIFERRNIEQLLSQFRLG